MTPVVPDGRVPSAPVQLDRAVLATTGVDPDPGTALEPEASRELVAVSGRLVAEAPVCEVDHVIALVGEFDPLTVQVLPIVTRCVGLDMGDGETLRAGGPSASVRRPQPKTPSPREPPRV